jgi:hypothetical protein
VSASLVHRSRESTFQIPDNLRQLLPCGWNARNECLAMRRKSSVIRPSPPAVPRADMSPANADDRAPLGQRTLVREATSPGELKVVRTEPRSRMPDYLPPNTVELCTPSAYLSGLSLSYNAQFVFYKMIEMARVLRCISVLQFIASYSSHFSIPNRRKKADISSWVA